MLKISWRSTTCLTANLQHPMLPQHQIVPSWWWSSPWSTWLQLTKAWLELCIISLSPSLTFAVHQVCQYMSAPTTTHLATAKRVLHYIRGTLNHGIEFTSGPLSLSAYIDTYWVGDPDDWRSTSGFLIYLGSNAITWFAKKQPTVSRSSTKSEYQVLAFASTELCWIRILLKDLGIYITNTQILWCDNVSALAIASNPVIHARTKHIEVDFQFVREQVLCQDLIVKFVSTVDQLADIFTKSLPTDRSLDLRHNLTIPVPVPELEGGWWRYYLSYTASVSFMIKH